MACGIAFYPTGGDVSHDEGLLANEPELDAKS